MEQQTDANTRSTIRINILITKFKDMICSATANYTDKRAAKNKLRDLQKILLGEIEEKNGKRALFPGRQEKLYHHYHSNNAAEAACHIATALNTKFNEGQSYDVDWIAINVLFMQYRVFKNQEIADLQILQETARATGVKHIVQEIEDLQHEFAREETTLEEMIIKVNPDNYELKPLSTGNSLCHFLKESHRVKLILADKIALFRGRKHSELLTKYHQSLLEPPNGPAEKQFDSRKNLAETNHSAQTLRREEPFDKPVHQLTPPLKLTSPIR